MSEKESAVIRTFFENCSDMPSVVSLRDHLMHALEGVAVAESARGKAVQFDVEYPAHSVCNDRKVITFQPPTGIKVKALAFDGHFGVFRALEKGVDERTKPLAHVTRKSFKSVFESDIHNRSPQTPHNTAQSSDLTASTHPENFIFH